MAMAFIHFIIIFTLTQVHSSKKKKKKKNPVYNSIVKNKKIYVGKNKVLPYRRLPKPPGELI